MTYEDRMMVPYREEAPKRSGHPTGAICVNCGSTMYFAEALQDKYGVHKNVEYCGGGCGNIIPADKPPIES